MELGPGINKGVYKYIGANKCILSVGCGSALLETLVKKQNNHVYGIDISPENVQEAKRKLDGAFLCDIEKAKKLPFKKESFDIIILSDILEHLLEPQKALEFLQAYVKPGGIVVASIPNVANWTVRIPLLFGNFSYGKEGIVVWPHYRFFTKKTARQLFEKNGYKVLKIDFTTSLINVTYDYIKKVAWWKKTPLQEKTIAFQQRQEQAKRQKDIFLIIKSNIKSILEQLDYFLTCLFPGIFAFQFIIIARKKSKD